MIRHIATIDVPPELVALAEPIKRENYKVNKPGKGQVRHGLADFERFCEAVAVTIGRPRDRLNFVFFSCCCGAEPHTDDLLTEYENDTWVIPVILPPGRSVITAGNDSVPATLGAIYQFDHTQTHSMALEDTESGCVVVMVAQRKEPA